MRSVEEKAVSLGNVSSMRKLSFVLQEADKTVHLLEANREGSDKFSTIKLTKKDSEQVIINKFIFTSFF